MIKILTGSIAELADAWIYWHGHGCGFGDGDSDYGVSIGLGNGLGSSYVVDDNGLTVNEN